jgi:hemoglobin
LNDITKRADIENLVNSFYDKVKIDPLLGPVFSHVNWPAHLPTMYNFWASMILGEQSYRGAPFPKHADLPISSTHFDQWLKLFTDTVDHLFTGTKAEEIKVRAQSIAQVFQHKMNLIK